ncbi:hypothetical protein BG015_002106 [Linnemannia schmuckeri]|uniref:Uncharacterized protein n=1 Tax=Linnemannia schmuckeri TaxID=64567 RepID=A0A9P5S5X6_9FUNG|nr:hypothetical protein BG015_002106 [Linnemannia schmuckeri]
MQPYNTTQQQTPAYSDGTTCYNDSTTEGYPEGMKLCQHDSSQQEGQGKGQRGLHHIDSDSDIHGMNPGAMTDHTLSSTTQQQHNNRIENKKWTMTVATMIDMTEYPEDRNDDGQHHQQQQQQQQQQPSNTSSSTLPAAGVRGSNGHKHEHGAQGQSRPQQHQHQPQHRSEHTQPQPQHRSHKSLPSQQQRSKQQQQQPQHPPNHYGYDLQQQQLQERNQRPPTPLQHEHHLQHQQQPQQQPNRPADSNSKKAQRHHPRPPKLILVAPPQIKEQQSMMMASPSPPPRKESLENAYAFAETGSENGNVSSQKQALLDDQAHYRAMIANSDSTVSLTGEKASDSSGNDGDSVVWTASPSSQSLCSRSNSFSTTTTTTNHSREFDTSTAGTSRPGSTGSAAGGGGGVSKSRSGSVSSGHVHVIRGSGSQTRMHSGGNGGGSVIVDMGISTLQPSVPSSPGKTGWEREDATPTTPGPVYQAPASKNGSTDNSKDSTTGTGAVGAGSGQQHSHSLFDFFRGRKSSIHKNSTFHQQAAAAAAAAYAASSGSESFAGIDDHPPPLPLMGTPPPIARSRLGSVSAVGPPVPPLLRKQSLDVSELNGYHRTVPGAAAGEGGEGPPRFDRHAATMPILLSSTSSPALGASGSGPRAGALTPTQVMDAITSSTIPSTSTANTNTSSSATTSNSAPSTLSRVAAAVVGVTVGKRRPSIANELEAGGNGFGLSKYREKPPPMPYVTKQQQHQYNYNQASGSDGIGGGAGLDEEQLQNHTKFMRSEKSMSELMEYVDRMYHTVMNKDVALEYSRTQISVLHKELDQNRVRSEDDRKTLTAEVDTVKEQVVKMEQNFLLWRTKVHNDQMAQQEEFLQERLVKQDRIEELEDALHASQEEATRLRNRLLVLEYEDGYIGPTAFLRSPTTISTSSSPLDYHNDPHNQCTTIAIEQGPMTVDTHKRRSGDFRVMEQRAQSFEGQVQELKRTMEKLRQDHCKDLAELRMKLGAKCSKLEHDAHAAKMESTVYNEMMHEVVTENDDLRRQIKDAQRKLRRQGLSVFSTDSGSANGSSTSSNGSGNATKSKSSSSSRPRRNPDHYGFPDDGSYSLDGSDDDDDMEDVII